MSQPWEIVQAKEDSKGSYGRSSVSSDAENKAIEDKREEELWLDQFGSEDFQVYGDDE
jgi:hypothetical protein